MSLKVGQEKTGGGEHALLEGAAASLSRFALQETDSSDLHLSPPLSRNLLIFTRILSYSR